MTEPTQIFLSPPDVGDVERKRLLEAFDSNWIAPLGPEVDGFEEDLARWAGTDHAVALSSGTAALHLALLLNGVGPGDGVVVPALTFAATAFAVTYVGAEPIFVDSEPRTWNLDAELLDRVLAERAAEGRPVKAVLTVDLYGQCADYDAIVPVCEAHGVPLIEDAAEALGASWQGRPAGSFGVAAAFSFNGNKIITTSGGGMLTTDDAALAAAARHRATQAREPALHYEHEVIGFNYRMSNLLAALGRGQLEGLAAKIDRRRAIRARYEAELGDLDGWSFQPIDPRGESNHWLTVAQLEGAPTGPVELITALAAERIESRPAWKPMHAQPVFAGATVVGGAVADAVFARGVCLPSGSSLTDDDQTRVIEAVRRLSR